MNYRIRRAQARQAEVSVKIAEYQVGSTRADFHTQLIWTWATTLVGVNAAGVGLLAQTDKYFEGRFLLVSLLAAAATFLVLWWNLAADRWHVLIRAWYVRLQEIEADLGMHLNRYVGMRDGPTLPEDHPDADTQALLREQTGHPNTGAIGPKKLRILLRFGVPATWALVMLAEAVAFVTAGRPCLLLTPSVECKALDPISYAMVLPLWLAGLIPMGLTWLALIRVFPNDR